jgi:hypothetical protein
MISSTAEVPTKAIQSWIDMTLFLGAILAPRFSDALPTLRHE